MSKTRYHQIEFHLRDLDLEVNILFVAQHALGWTKHLENLSIAMFPTLHKHRELLWTVLKFY